MLVNPFNLTFGDVPKIYLDKEELSHTVIDKIEYYDYAQSFFITGVRGSGKTSFLTYISQKLLDNNDNYVIDLMNKKGMIYSLLQQLLSKVKKHRFFDDVSSIGIASFSFSRQKQMNDDEAELIQLFEKIKKENKRVIVFIDEVTNNEEIRELLQYFSLWKRKEYPIHLVMAGLPEVILEVQNDDRLTFLLRAERITMDYLNKADMVSQYRKVLNCSLEVASKMAQLTKGYSYAFQLLGFLCFEATKEGELTLETIEKLLPDYQYRLFANVYQKIFLSLSEQDRHYLLAVAEHQTFSEIVSAMQQSKNYVSQYRRRAIEKGLITPSGHGKVVYTLPFFENYLLEVQNPDSVYYMGY